MKLVLNLNFFAAVMQVPREEVSYGLLKVTEKGFTEYRPVVTARSYPLGVYDLQIARMTSVLSEPEVERALEPATARKSRRGIILKSATSGVEEVYTTLDFYNTFRTVVANDYWK